jgi:division protein CdvB (Snf7/Vps24/ESCRT-III family)
MDQQENTTLDQGEKLWQNSRAWQYASANSSQKRKNKMSKEETDLATHVEICAIRYQGIQEKIDGLTERLDNVESKINTLSKEIQSNFSRIELALEKANAKRDVQIIATMGTIAVAVITAIGYWLVKH